MTAARLASFFSFHPGQAVHRRGMQKGKRRMGLRIITGLLLFLVLVYNVLFYPPVFQRILPSLLPVMAGGQLKLQVERASLFRGFVIRDIELQSGGTTLFRAESATLSYFLPSILVGHIGIRDFSLVKPRIFLQKKGGVWNFEELTGKSEEKVEVEEPSSPLPDVISTYVALKVYGKIVVRDLRFTLDMPDDGEFLDIDHFSLHLAFITRTFQEIPVSPRAFTLFDTLILGVAPDAPVSIERRGAGGVRGELSMPFFLYREALKGEAEFSSRFHLNTADLVLTQKGRQLIPNARIYYSVAYDAQKDRLNLSRFLIEQDRHPWIDLSAGADGVTKEVPVVRLDMHRSEIGLDSLENLLVFLGVRMGLRGTASLYPLKIDGPLDRLSLLGKFQADQLAFRTGAMLHRVPMARLDLSALLNVAHFLPEGKKKENEGLAFGVFHRLSVPELLIGYNESRIRGNAVIEPGRGMTADLVVSGLALTPFSAPAFDGIASGQLKVQSPETFKTFALKSELHLSQARYRMEESRSSPMELGLVLDGNIGLGDSTTVDLSRIVLSAGNAQGINLVTLRASSNMNIGEAQSYAVNIKELSVRYADLHSTLPGGLRYSLSPYRSYLDKGVGLGGTAVFKSAGETSSLLLDLSMAVPGLDLKDLRVAGGMSFLPAKTTFDNIKMTGLRGALQVAVSGKIDKSPEGSKPDLKVALSLASQSLFAIHKNLAIQGGLKMDFAIQSDAVRGNVAANDLSAEIYTDCEEAVCRKKYRLERMNLLLPVFHDLKLKDPALLAEAPTGLTFDSTAFRAKPNLSVQFIASGHSPRGEAAKDGFFYAGALLPDRPPGLTASLEYRKNVLYFRWLKYQIYRPRARQGNDLWVTDGSIEGRDVFFNLADAHPENMEFGGRMQVQNFDLEPFLPRSRSDYDGIISAELQFKGRNLSNALYNTTGRLSVYRLSREFSGFATRIVMPTAVAGMIVKSALEIPSITVELQNGLVYTAIGISRKDISSFTNFLSFLIKPTGEEIRQERIPLAQFLERAKSEVEAGVTPEESQAQ